MSRRFRPTLCAFAVVLALALGVLGWRASETLAQASEPVPPSPLSAGSVLVQPAAPLAGGPGFYSQNGLAFKPYPSQATPFNYTGAKLVNPDTAAHYYMAPVTLPQGATITKFTVWYFDNDAGRDMNVDLYRLALNSEFGEVIASVSSAGAAPANRLVEDTTITGPVVDAGSYSYTIQANLPPSNVVGLVAFRIDYQYATFVPTVRKN